MPTIPRVGSCRQATVSTFVETSIAYQSSRCRPQNCQPLRLIKRRLIPPPHRDRGHPALIIEEGAPLRRLKPIRQGRRGIAKEHLNSVIVNLNVMHKYRRRIACPTQQSSTIRMLNQLRQRVFCPKNGGAIRFTDLCRDQSKARRATGSCHREPSARRLALRSKQ